MNFRTLRIALLISALPLFFGCATYIQKPDQVTFYLSPNKIEDPGEFTRIRETVKAVNQKNLERKNSPERLTGLYNEIRIRKVNDIPPEQLADYAKFVDPADPKAYVIVHPAYYAFFMNNSVLSSSRDIISKPPENIVEKFCSRNSFNDRELRVMQEQERVLRDFLQTAFAEKKLVVLVLPPDYKSHLSYGYMEGNDEYARYINEITESTDSVVYIESLDFSSGYLGEASLSAVKKLFQSAGVREIMLGGEFAGRCLDNAYYSLHRKFDGSEISIVPELTAVTGRDLSVVPEASTFTKDGMLNFREISRILKYVKKDPAEGIRLRHFFIYDVQGGSTEPLN